MPTPRKIATVERSSFKRAVEPGPNGVESTAISADVTKSLAVRTDLTLKGIPEPPIRPTSIPGASQEDRPTEDIETPQTHRSSSRKRKSGDIEAEPVLSGGSPSTVKRQRRKRSKKVTLKAREIVDHANVSTMERN